jgi:Fe-S oxidoreductase
MRLSRLPARTPEQEARLKTFKGSYEYDGDATCAADGMCQEKCPVKINTGAVRGMRLWCRACHLQAVGAAGVVDVVIFSVLGS